MVGAAAAAPAPLFSEATRGGRVWFSAVTVAGLVPGDPDELFSVFADPARAAGAGVFTNVRSCREVARGQPRLSHQRHVLQRVDVEQVARLQVLRLALDAPMTVRLDCNHTLRQVGGGRRLVVCGRFVTWADSHCSLCSPPLPVHPATPQVHLQLLKGNALMRRFEGQYHVLPWDATERTPPALPAGLAEALGPEAARQLAAKLAAMAADRPSSGTQAPRQPSKLAKQPQGRQPGGKPQQSLVILHQKLHPGVRPPPGLGGYVRGERQGALCACARVVHLCQTCAVPCPAHNTRGHPRLLLPAGQVLREFERMLRDLHSASQKLPIGPRPTLQSECEQHGQPAAGGIPAVRRHVCGTHALQRPDIRHPVLAAAPDTAGLGDWLRSLPMPNLGL